ncbi:MAG: hypothetical protein J6Z03_03875 [Erysipelotrichaceae bacterium]|nr:hypothetical protein [Erysipelotrichaceae bacterium]
MKKNPNGVKDEEIWEAVQKSIEDIPDRKSKKTDTDHGISRTGGRQTPGGNLHDLDER